MIRTRDFLLFVVIFIFLLAGISFTVVQDATHASRSAAHESSLSTTAGESLTAVTTSALDRDSNLEALRKKIARGEGVIAGNDPVFTSVDTPTSSITDADSGTVFITDRKELYCSQKSYSATALMWNPATASFATKEGARLISIEQFTTATVGTSTVSTTTKRIALQLPLSALESSTTYCLDSEHVGVALDGSLIRNNEAWRFRNYAAESVVGYARDGFPIAGSGADETMLDACGGYNDGTGYRYYIRANEAFVLGCYRGVPQPFIES